MDPDELFATPSDPPPKPKAHGIQKVSYTHDAMIDLIIAQPTIKRYEIAAQFGVTGPWISRVINSDAFRARLAARKSEVVDPIILASLEEKLLGVMDQSLEVIADKLDSSKSPELAIKALELSAKALGYGARKENVQQTNFVVMLPEKSQDSESWKGKYSPGVVDVTPVSSARSTPTPDKNEGSDLMRLARGAGVAPA